MDYYNEMYEAHSVHDNLSNAKTAFDSCRGLLTEQVEHEIGNRIEYCLEIVESIVNNYDPRLMPRVTLDGLSDALNELAQAMELFAGSNASLELADSRASLVLSSLAFPLEPFIGGLAQAELVEGSRRKAEDVLGEMRVATNEVMSLKGDLSTRLESVVQSLNEYEDAFTNQVFRIDRFVDSAQETMLARQDDKEKLHAQWIAEQKSEFDIVKHDAKNEYARLAEEFGLNAEKKLGIIQSQLDSAVEIVGTIANTGYVGHYQSVASSESRTANFMRFLAIIFMLGMVVSVVMLIYTVAYGDFNWSYGLFKFGVSAVMLIPAYYCAKESALHRVVANRNRRLAVELATLRPFLQQLDDSEKEAELLASLAMNYYGHSDQAGQAQVSEDDIEHKITMSPTELVGFMKSLKQLLM